MRKTALILNASAGWKFRRRGAEELRDIFAARGFEVELLEVRRGIDCRKLAQAAVERGAERVIAGGGDGTLRAVAAGLAGTGVEMGVLPAGTLNHFARDLELPLDVEMAAETAAAGTPVSVDLGEVNGTIFINNSALGLFPAYRFEKARRQRRGWGRKLAALAAMLALFRRFPRLTVRLQAEGREIVRRTPFMLIANNEHAMEGFKPWQRERLTEGKLWIYIMRERGRLGLLRVLFKIFTGAFRGGDEFEVLRASEVLIETPRRKVGVGIDGEVVTLPTPLRYRSLPGVLRVLVPPDSKRVAEAVSEPAGGSPFAS